LDGNWFQIVPQILDTLAGLIWSFLVSYVILYLMNKTSILSLKLNTNQQLAGADISEMGITLYEHIEELKLDCFQMTPRPDSGELYGKPITRSVHSEIVNVQSHSECEQEVARNTTDVHTGENNTKDWRSYWK